MPDKHEVGGSNPLEPTKKFEGKAEERGKDTWIQAFFARCSARRIPKYIENRIGESKSSKR